MVVAVIGVVALAASVGSWFVPGIVLGAGLIVVGVAIELAPGESS
jgi:hypothetical protein